MRLLDALSPSATVFIPEGCPVNILAIACDCGVRFAWQSRFSLVQCPGCGAQALWHDVTPKPESGPWSQVVMASVVGR